MKKWLIPVVAVIGMALGAYLNYLTTKAANDKLFAQIKSELDALKGKQQGARLSIEESNKLKQLEGALLLERVV